MPDDDGQIGLGQQTVALDHIAHFILTVTAQIRRNGVMIHDAVRPEHINRLFPQVPVPFFQGVLTVQTHGAHQGDVLQFGACGQQILHDHGDGHLAVAGGLNPALDPVREADHHLLIRTTQFLERRKSQGIVQGPAHGRMGIHFRRIGVGFTVTHHRGAFRQIHCHMPVAVFQ